MAWYYYSGRKPRPIPVRKGLSVSVAPHDKVEIFDMSIEARSMIRQGVLRRCAAPKDKGTGRNPVDVAAVRAVLEPSALKQRFADKGTTTARTMPPKVGHGAPEMTVDELEVGARVSAQGDEESAPAAESVDVLSDAVEDHGAGELPEGTPDDGDADSSGDDSAPATGRKRKRK